jgi:DNA-binding MarR family transcriptional regulator
MSGDSAGAAMGQQSTAEQSSGQQSSGQQSSGQQGIVEAAAGQEGAGPQGAAEQAAAEQAAAEQAAAEQAAGQAGAGPQGTAEQDARQAGAGPQGAAGEGAADSTARQGIEELSRAGWELPWPESPTSGTGPQERAELEVAFATAMRRTGSLMQLMGQAAADRIGINNTDLNCLNILSFSGHMTAGELAKATGLTTASITGVIDRLEEAGFVRRERDPHDRRRVVVRLSLDKAVSDVASVFAPMLRDWREMARRYSDDELRLIVDFYGRVEQVFRKHLIRLRDE